MTAEGWALMQACAREVLAAARPWWSGADESVRAQLGVALIVLSETMARQHARHDPTPRPATKESREELASACSRAAEAIRVNVAPYDERGTALWEAGARLAYATAGIKADATAK